MGNIHRLPEGIHDEVRTLLPWYVTHALDADDHARVAAHLDMCRECAAQFDADMALGRDIVRTPRDVDHGWAQMRERLDLDATAAVAPAVAPAHVWARPRAAAKPSRWSWLGWTIGTQTVFASLIAAFFAVQMPRYAALDGGDGVSDANLIVIFRPETPERALRQALVGVDARLVDGPTSANAYLLHVPGERRERSLGSLRAMPQIVMAEPIEQGAAR